MIKKYSLFKNLIIVGLLLLLISSPIILVFYLGGFPICIENVTNHILFYHKLKEGEPLSLTVW